MPLTETRRPHCPILRCLNPHQPIPNQARQKTRRVRKPAIRSQMCPTGKATAHRKNLISHRKNFIANQGTPLPK